MIPIESLYGKKCNTLGSWDNSAYKVIIRPTLLRDMEEKMVKIKLNLNTT
jgi:hypothetical protein